jgi:hypothetical protein
MHGTVRWVEILCGLCSSVSNIFLLFHVLLCLTIVMVFYTERRDLHLLVLVSMSGISLKILLSVFFSNSSDFTIKKRTHTHCISVYSLYENRISTSFVLPYTCCKTNWLHCVQFRVLLALWLCEYAHTGTAVAQWLRYCATNWKVAGSIPDGVIGICHWHNPSDRTMALGLTRPLTEMNTRSTSWG